MKQPICHKVRYLFVALLTMMAVSACDGSYRNLAEKRRVKSEKAGKEIVIGVVTSRGNDGMFLEGIHMALKEINDGGGLFGRRIRLIIRDDGGRVDKAKKVARELAHNTDVTAVIGHLQSEIALAVGMIYESAGVLFLSPGATDPRLTQLKNGKFIFRNIPSDDVILGHLVEYCQGKGIKRCVVIYERSENTMRQAKIFGEFAKSAGMEIVATRSYFNWQEDYRIMASKLISNYQFDGVFLTGQLPTAGHVIKQMRELGCETPFFCMPSLDTPKLGGIIGREAEGTTVPTVFYPKRLSEITREFVNRFETIYELSPDTMAAQGFDALTVLAHAMRKKGSSVPIVAASMLRFLDDWQGVAGTYGFTLNGDIEGSTIYFKEFRNGKFEYQESRRTKDEIDPSYVIEDISLRIPIKKEVVNIDPAKAQCVESTEIFSHLFEGLTHVDPRTFKPVPALAEKYIINKDETVYTFTLRKDVKWSNGDALTAHDIVWSILRNLSPETGYPDAGALAVLKNARAYFRGEVKDPARVGVRAIADDMVEFELSDPVPYFISLTGLTPFKPLPRTVIEKYKEKWTDPANIVSSGPYKLTFWKKGRRIVLKKNPLYHNEARVRIPEVHYFVIPDESVGFAMYKNHELDIMGGPYLNIPEGVLGEIHRNPSLAGQYSSWPQVGTYAYCFNTRRTPTDDPRLRKAIASVIDRNLIISLVLQTRNKPADTFTHPLVLGGPGSNTHSGTGIPFDPETGRKWLMEAGYPGGRNFPVIDLLCLKTERDRRLADAVKLLAGHHLNIEIRVVEADSDEYGRLIRSDNAPHLFMYENIGKYPDPTTFLKELFHLPQWQNREFAALIDQAEKTMAPDKRKALYARAETILCRETAALIPVFYGAGHVLVNPRVRGWYFSPFAEQHIEDWWLEE
ncbi:MAG: ABC transporter substrate-binding protein [Desulfobacteraceae bacterium]|nr:ABC transporter substrate-binding protein [Desulfobacteraceae bacterium]